MRRIVGAVVLVMATMACAGSSEPTTASSKARIEGTVVQRSLDNARAIAITPDGRRTWSYLDVRGHFTLELPAGRAYRLMIANTLPDGSFRAIGHLVIHASNGVGRWLDLRSGALDLGALSTKGASSSPTLGTKSEGEGDHGSSDSDEEEIDTETHDDDDDEHGVCADHHEGGEDRDDDVELSAEHEPGDEYADEHEKDHDDEDEGEHPCAKAPPPAPPASAPPPASPPPTSAPPASPPPGNPPGGLGSPCVVTAGCATGLACVASRCVVALR